MTTNLPPLADSYIRSTNNQDSATFLSLFADDAVVDDNFREIRGLAAIQAWSERDIFAAQVMLEVLDVAVYNGHVVVTTKVDGNFDRTGLPDPVIISHELVAVNGKIVGLTCRLTTAPATALEKKHA